MWQKDLQALILKYKDYKMEIESTPQETQVFSLLMNKDYGPKMAVYLPHILPKNIQKEIRDIVPSEVHIEFIEAIKPSIINQIRFLATQAGCISISNKGKDRDIKIELGQSLFKSLEITDNLWSKISDEFYNDGYYDTWEIVYGDIQLLYNRKVMDEVMRHPKGACINKEAIDDLKIALGMSKDVNDFLAILS